MISQKITPSQKLYKCVCNQLHVSPTQTETEIMATERKKKKKSPCYYFCCCCIIEPVVTMILRDILGNIICSLCCGEDEESAPLDSVELEENCFGLLACCDYDDDD